MLPLILLLAATTAIVLGLVLGPLLKPARPPVARAAYDRAIYRDQIKELERDVARGTVPDSEAGTARLELQRRLLSAEGDPAPTTGGARKPLIAVATALLIALIAGGIYADMGSPGLPDDPYAARQAERDQAAQQQAQMVQIHAMVAKLADAMKAHPDDLDGWMRLGRSYAVLGQADDAAAAFAHAETLKPDDPGILMAEAQALMAGHSMAEPLSNQVVALLDRVQTISPDTPAVMWYLGLHAAQQGDFATARADWQKVKAAMPQGSDESKTVAAALDAIKDK
ncbi:MAG TPA: c-type cytochrome biogenesis protein CcmI [Stellaceae bacterium]|nr:c-type cytochrome biogenesis protein CcmI [Stellaceae bacterium]